MRKENLITVDKDWGEEITLVNNEFYCAKFLVLDIDATIHCNPCTRTKTFVVIEGSGRLAVGDKMYFLTPYTRPKTIEPMEKYSLEAITEAVILEISSLEERVKE